MDTGRSFPDTSSLGQSTSRSGGGGGVYGSEYGTSVGGPLNVQSQLSSGISVTVQVRDVTLSIELGQGQQTFRWLAFHAAQMYAQQHPHVSGAETFTPINLTDESGNSMFPSEIICEKVENGDSLRLELIGPTLGLNSPNFKRERSLWELYAYSSQDSARSSLVPLVFLFDASELALSAPPGVFGNFNSWGVPIVMQWWKGNLYKHQMEVPAGSEIVFKFSVGGSSILTPHTYPIVHDSQGNKLHYIRVAPIPPLASLDASNAPLLSSNSSNEPTDASAVLNPKKRVFTLGEIIEMNQRAQTAYLASEKLLRNGQELPVLSARLVGCYPGSKASRTDVRASDRLSRRDWSDLKNKIGDVFPAVTVSATGEKKPTKMYGVKLAELKQVLLKYHAEFTSVFQYYSSGTQGCSPKGQSWNLLKFISFLQLIKIPDATRTTVARLDKIYFMVVNGTTGGSGGVAGSRSSGDIPLSQKEIKSSNNSLGKVLLHQEDPFSILNQMTRTGFVHALVRVAMLKYKNPTSLADYQVTIDGGKEKDEKKTDGTVVIPPIGGKDKHAQPPPPPPQAQEPNPALSLELLVKNHLQPFAIQTAQAGSLAYSPTPIGGTHNPNELRMRFINDPNVFGILEQYSGELQRLFKHYTGGAPASGLSLGILASLPGSAGGTGVGIIGGTSGVSAAGVSNLPPTLLGQSLSSGGLLNTLLPGTSGGAGHNPNGSLRTQPNTPISSATIHLRELENMLNDYELLDPSITRQRALANLGIAPEEGAEEIESTLELLYPEWLELLVRIAATGTQWSNLYLEQQRLIAAAIAAGTLNPLDKPPASMLIAQQVQGDDDHDGDGEGSFRRTDETELCERFLRLIHWLFPSEAEQRERRAKLAAQQNAQAAPVAAPVVKEEKKAEEAKDGGGKESAKGTGKGKPGAKVSAAKAPVKKAPAKK